MNGSHLSAVRALVSERAGHDWCLFLDRDGVINRQIVGDYVRSWQQFQWLPNAVPALKKLRDWAPHLVVVTNQQGVGKGFMSADAVEHIHQNLIIELASEGVVVDAIQMCPHLELAGCGCRKPGDGLVMGWLEGHPSIEPRLSMVAGDSGSDMDLARNVAIRTGGCAGIQIGGADLGGVAVASFGCLWDFALAVEDARREQGS